MTILERLWSGYLGGAIGIFAVLLVVNSIWKITRQPPMDDVTWTDILRTAAWSAVIWPVQMLADLGRLIDGWVRRHYDMRRRSGMHA